MHIVRLFRVLTYSISRMKISELILSILVLLAASSAATSGGRGPVSIKYAEMWRRANQVFAMHGLAVTRADSELGVIEGSRNDGAMEGWFNCPPAQGAAGKKGYSVTVLLDASGTDGTNVRITAFGTATWHRNRYFLVFKKSPLRGEDRCESTGKLEQMLYSEMVGFPTSES